MKFANRFNVFHKKGQNLEVGDGDYFRIAHVEPSWIRADMLTLANVANLAPGDAIPAVGGAATSGVLIPQLVPKHVNTLIHCIPAVASTRVVSEAPVDGSGAPAGPLDEVREISPRYTLFGPESQPRWFNPDYRQLGFIDSRITPIEDPNETFAFYLMHNDEPAFRVTNPDPFFTFTEALLEFHFMIYELEALASKPAIYTPVSYDRTLIASFAERAKLNRY